MSDTTRTSTPDTDTFEEAVSTLEINDTELPRSEGQTDTHDDHLTRSAAPSPSSAVRRVLAAHTEPSSPAKSVSSVSTSQLSAAAAPFSPSQARNDTRESGQLPTSPGIETNPPPKPPTPTPITYPKLSAHPGPAPAPGPTSSAHDLSPMCTVVQVTDLHWFTSDADLVAAASAADIHLTHRDVTFLEHKCNGKSKGIAFINCHSPAAMLRLMKWFETHEFQGKRIPASMSTTHNGKPPIPPPTHDKDNGGLGFRPSHDDSAAPPRAPLPFMPTNAHGGVNFNRVPLHHRQQMQQMQQAGFLNPAAGNRSGVKRNTGNPGGGGGMGGFAPVPVHVPVPMSMSQGYPDAVMGKMLVHGAHGHGHGHGQYTSE